MGQVQLVFEVYFVFCSRPIFLLNHLIYSALSALYILYVCVSTHSFCICVKGCKGRASIWNNGCRLRRKKQLRRRTLLFCKTKHFNKGKLFSKFRFMLSSSVWHLANFVHMSQGHKQQKNQHFPPAGWRQRPSVSLCPPYKAARCSSRLCWRRAVDCIKKNNNIIWFKIFLTFSLIICISLNLLLVS